MNKTTATLQNMQAWSNRVSADGWLSESIRDRVIAHTPHDPTALFADQTSTPLVLAFFGGTGVGKSSLLNRLAGSPVAKSSAVRPTSREVTLYLHDTVDLAELPDGIPVELTNIKRHQQDQHRNTLWIDTPDIDSVITTHRDQVLAWLPFVDLLVYVVNPERYRDDAGWDMLQANRHRHDWAFVINHWDRGDPAQRDDFVRLLTEGGIESPQVFCTDCRDGGQASDDFAELQRYVALRSEDAALEAARRRAQTTEQQAIEALRTACGQALGKEESWSAVASALESERQTFATQCLIDTALKREHTLHKMFPDPPPPFWRRVLGADDRPAPLSTTPTLWSSRNQDRLKGRLDDMLIRAADGGVPVAPLRQAWQTATEHAGDVINSKSADQLAQALDNPGSALQRFAVRCTQALTILLPLVTVCWVAYRALQGFAEGATNPDAYLGLDFLTNGILLIALSAAIPAILTAAIKPSARRAASRALEEGVSNGCARIEKDLQQALDNTRSRRDELVSELGAL